MKEPPFFSHIHFEALVSLSTAEQLNRSDKNFEKWPNMSLNYVYLRLPEKADMTLIQAQLDTHCKAGNTILPLIKIT